MGFDPESGNGGSSKVTPPPLATAFVHVQAQLFMSEIAAAIGETADAARFTAAHAKLKAAFHARFYDPEAGGYAPCVDAVPSALRCPEGETLDSVGADGDDGSCDCDDFCASDWNGKIKKARPHWTGAASAVPGAHTDCMCVQGSHWCPKAGACASSCKALGKPKPVDFCVKGAPTQGICHGTSSHGSQTSNALALALGAPPDEATAKIVAQNLANDVMHFRNKTTTGVVGIGFLFPQLDKYGYGELALSTLVQDECKLRTSRLPARRSYVWRWSQTLRSATWLTRT